jgi:signal transduction histidine kinase
MVSIRRTATKAVLSVADNGSGLPPQILDAILKKPIESTKAHGTGLGMTICRHIALAHNADMRVESRAGGGTTFTLEFPLAQA